MGVVRVGAVQVIIVCGGSRPSGSCPLTEADSLTNRGRVNIIQNVVGLETSMQHGFNSLKVS